MSARKLLPACLLALLAGVCAAPANAQVEMTPRQQSESYLKRMLGALPGDKAVSGCFARTYDAAHLASHPQQKVTQVVMLLHVGEISSDDHVSYNFVAGFRQRGKKGLFIGGGSCGHSRAVEDGPITHMTCGVDCDGGGMKVEMSAGDKSLLVSINEYISVEPQASWNRTDEPPERQGIKPGADDKVFRLDRVALDQCASLFETKKAFREFLEMK